MENVGITNYSFATAEEMEAGRALLEAEEPGRYSMMTFGKVYRPTGQVDSEGLPTYEDAGYGFVLSVLDNYGPYTVPGWEQAQIPGELIPHRWSGLETEELMMDEEAPETFTPIAQARRPTPEILLELREAQVERLQANLEVRRIKAELVKVRNDILVANKDIQEDQPKRREDTIARIQAFGDERRAIVDRIQELRDQAQAAEREEREILQMEIEGLRAQIDRMEVEQQARIEFREGFNAMMTEKRAARDGLTAHRNALQAEIETARTARAQAVQAIMDAREARRAAREGGSE